MRDVILEVKNLRKYFKTPKGMLHAVDDVSFSIERGKTLGLVGESGCGKSTTGRAILRLVEPTSGEVHFDGCNVLALSKRDLQKKRGEMQIIFQDPYSSIDPRKAVFESIEEPLKVNQVCKTRQELAERVYELMRMAGISERYVNSYPHELDGGRRQRVGIARALALNPKFIVLDEPVSALDVSIQAQVLNLLQQRQAELGLTYLFISHDLSVVKHISHKIAVMYLGRIVEISDKDKLFNNTLHPYSIALLSAIPQVDTDHKVHRIVLKGDVVSPINPKPQCRFAPRCWMSQPICFEQEPELCEVEPGHCVACHFAHESRVRAQSADVISLDNK